MPLPPEMVSPAVREDFLELQEAGRGDMTFPKDPRVLPVALFVLAAVTCACGTRGNTDSGEC